jgi:hypothetical protein
MVTLFYVTDQSLLKGLSGITIFPVRSRDSPSATVTSNYGRAVTILPTELIEKSEYYDDEAEDEDGNIENLLCLFISYV